MLLILISCGGGGDSSSGSGGGSSSNISGLLGNWSGSWTSSSNNSGSLSVEWIAVVPGGNTLAGFITIGGSLCGGAVGGTPGTVSGNNITFSINGAIGSVIFADSVIFTGTYTSTSISGTYSGTGVCSGTGTFSLTKHTTPTSDTTPQPMAHLQQQQVVGRFH